MAIANLVAGQAIQTRMLRLCTRGIPFRSIARPARMQATPVMLAARLQARTVVTTRFTRDHEWVAFDDETGLAKIGITDYAQDSLGDATYVELPEPLTEIVQGERIGGLESVKAASDIYAPISGEVTEVNEQLVGDEGLVHLINESPRDEGWLAVIKASQPAEVDALFDEAAYEDFLKN